MKDYREVELARINYEKDKRILSDMINNGLIIQEVYSEIKEHAQRCSNMYKNTNNPGFKDLISLYIELLNHKPVPICSGDMNHIDNL